MLTNYISHRWDALNRGERQRLCIHTNTSALSEMFIVFNVLSWIYVVSAIVCISHTAWLLERFYFEVEKIACILLHTHKILMKRHPRQHKSVTIYYGLANKSVYMGYLVTRIYVQTMSFIHKLSPLRYTTAASIAQSCSLADWKL